MEVSPFASQQRVLGSFHVTGPGVGGPRRHAHLAVLENDHTLRRIADRIVDALDPGKVIRFGPRAQDEATSHSDDAICGIMEPSGRPRTLVRQTHDRFDVWRFLMATFVVGPAELRQQR